MRRVSIFAVAALALSAAACATKPADKPQKIETTTEPTRQNVQGAAEAPLRDSNVLRTKIPPVLLDALVDPYARPPRGLRLTKAQQCAQLNDLVQPLDDALGADLDNP